MANPISSKINKESNVSLGQNQGYIHITSVLKDVNITIDGVTTEDKVSAQEFYSPIRCTSFSAPPQSLTYQIIT